MYIVMKNIEIADIDLMPVESSESESSGYISLLSERDSAFQRMLSTVTGFFKPSQKKVAPPDDIPEEEKQVEQPAAQPTNVDGIVIRGKQQLRTLYHLLHATDPGGIPISRLQHLVGSGNQWDTVARLNNNVGLDIVQATYYLIVNKTGKATRRANYWLTAEGKRIAAEILTRSGYAHDPVSEGRHLNRPGLVTGEFIASSSLDGDDLLFLRDGTKPQWLRLLYLLRAMEGEWVPRYVADELLDSRNVREVVRQLVKKLGGKKEAVLGATRTMPNRDGGVCEYGLYRLAAGWDDVAEKLIRSALVMK